MPEPEGGDDDAKPNDLRFTSHERNRISVDRNLAADGHLARGDKTRMSRMNFTARARPADPGERDPVFVEREPVGAEGEDSPPVDAPAEAPAETPGLIERLGRLFGR